MYRQAILQIFPKWHFWNNRVYFSHVQLKENFQKTLEVIRNSNQAQKFCGILINAKEVIQKSDCISLHPPVEISLNKDELDAHSIICELKEIIHEDKPEYILIDTILKAFNNSLNEARQQLISLLFSIDTVNFLNPKSQSSKEYLKYFINDVECFLRKANKNYCNITSENEGALKILETRLFFSLQKEIGEIDWMNTVNSVIVYEGQYSDDHNREIEALVSDAVSLISTRLLQLNNASKSIIEKCLLARRSSLVIDEDDSSLEKFYLDQIIDCYYILNKVPFYYMTRKERLLQHLKDTKSSYNACEFCELLSSINKLSSDTDSNKESLNSDLIMNRLKDINHTEKPEYNINKFILMALRNRTHHLKEVSELLSRFFLDVDNFDCGKQNSEEYLRHFIQEFERLINLYVNKLYTHQSALEAISTTLMGIARCCTEEDLMQAFLCKYHLHFFDEEKKKIRFLMAEAITPIQKFVCGICFYDAHSKIKSFLLLRRSALQYFKEFIDSFPVDETQSNRFDMNRIDLCIQELDRSIDYMCQAAESRANLEESEDEGEETESDFSDFYEHDDLEEDGASKVPESHTWWAKCSQTLNRIRNL